ncbi:MAG: zinc-ribbon domain-containing protein [Dehalococcoidales bacterium]|nr:zinc-ribbon domain-containing protein [Dehalococcoidales bacterium]
MVFLFGNKDYYDLLGYITMKCPNCKTQRIFAVKQERKKLTVYFIPTFQFSSRQIVVCQYCREALQVDDELKPKVAENMISQKKLDSMIKRGKVDNLIEAVPKRRTRNAVKMRCAGCGSEIDKKMIFCPQCGNRI